MEARRCPELLRDIKEYPEWRAKNYAAQLDRYKGWMCLSSEAARFYRENLPEARAVLASNGFQARHWSSLSGDPDDENDIGIRRRGG